MNNEYPKDYRKKYWKEVRRKSYDKERRKIDTRGEFMRRVISVALGFAGVGLLVYFSILKLQQNETVASIVFGLFIADFMGFIGMLISIPVLACLNKPEIAAYRDWKQLEKIKELEPSEANIEIMIPHEGFREGNTVKLIVFNKNETADLEKCFARFVLIDLIFEHGQNYPLDRFPFQPENYQKNLLWDRRSFEDGTITISAGGNEVLNIIEVVSDGFNFLFQNREKYNQKVVTPNELSCDYVALFSLHGKLNGKPLKRFYETYKIHIDMLATIQQPKGKELSIQEIASNLSNPRQPRLVIRKIEIDGIAKNQEKDEKKDNPLINLGT